MTEKEYGLYKGVRTVPSLQAVGCDMESFFFYGEIENRQNTREEFRESRYEAVSRGVLLKKKKNFIECGHEIIIRDITLLVLKAKVIITKEEFETRWALGLLGLTGEHPKCL
jgi:hypothetical protein